MTRFGQPLNSLLAFQTCKYVSLELGEKLFQIALDCIPVVLQCYYYFGDDRDGEGQHYIPKSL